MKNILNRSIREHAAAFEAKEYSSRELTKAFLDNIDSDINAYISVCAEKALKCADESDKRRKNGNALGLLDGIPYAAKDNIAVRGVKLTCGSKMLENYISPYDATVIERLSAGGAVLLGKSNLDEFAMGTGNETSYFGNVKNPLDRTRVPGGSSGGGAAAVAANEACFALGSDTGGSVRQPAAFCGLVGLRPTYSALSRYGLVGFAPSLDTVGILTRNTDDCKIVLAQIAARDTRDSTTSYSDAMYDLSKLQNLKGVKIALVTEALECELDERVRKTLMRSAELLRDLGAIVREISLPSLDSAYATYYTLSSAEGASNLSRFDGVRFGYRAEDATTLDEMYTLSRSRGFGQEVKRRILFGAMALSKDFKRDIYDRAILKRERISRELEETLLEYDAFLMPTCENVAHLAGTKKNSFFDANTKGDLLCTPASLAGLPALSLPDICHDLPTSVQLVGAKFSDQLLLSIGTLLTEVL